MHWGQHLLRPEFVESTYFLYRATRDPYYLEAGEKVLRSLQKHARVTCGYASIKVRLCIFLRTIVQTIFFLVRWKYWVLFTKKGMYLFGPYNRAIFLVEANFMVLLFVFMAGSRPFFLAVLYFGSKYFVHFEIVFAVGRSRSVAVDFWRPTGRSILTDRPWKRPCVDQFPRNSHEN